MVSLKKRLADLVYCPETGFITFKGAATGTVDKSHGYVKVCADCKRFYAHRVAWLKMTGEWPPFEIDHINRVRTDNRWCNLRLANKRENRCNRTISATANTSGFKGVHFAKHVSDKTRKKWRAEIWHKGKKHCLGYFLTPEEASSAYRVAATRLHGEFAS